jgi:hypothetical protein
MNQVFDIYKIGALEPLKETTRLTLQNRDKARKRDSNIMEFSPVWSPICYGKNDHMDLTEFII